MMEIYNEYMAVCMKFIENMFFSLIIIYIFSQTDKNWKNTQLQVMYTKQYTKTDIKRLEKDEIIFV